MKHKHATLQEFVYDDDDDDEDDFLYNPKFLY